MINLKNDSYHLLNDGFNVSKKFSIKIRDIKEGEKMSIMSDTMFKTMFMNSNRLKYSAKFLSYFLDVSYETLIKKIRLAKDELNKNKESSKAERCDYVAEIDDTLLNIEVNCNGNVVTLERNMEYAHRLYASKIKSGSKYNYSQVIQFNLNNFSFKDNDKIFDYYYIQNKEGIRLTNKLIFVQIFIPNLRKKCYNEGIEKLSELERYILTLVETDVVLAKEISKGDAFMEQTIDESKEFYLSSDIGMSYDHEKANLEAEFEDGKNEGIVQTKVETAQNLDKLGVDKEIIAKSINVDLKELDEMLKEQV